MALKNLVIEGNIGAGKTLLAQMISEKYGGRMIGEQMSPNPFLPKFYSDPARYALPLEISLLAERYSQVKEAITPARSNLLSVWDYHIGKSMVFSGITLNDDDLKIFARVYSVMSERFPAPDLYVYLHKTVEKLQENIRKRGRPYERGIDASYLLKIEKGYFGFMKKNKDLKILIIHSSKLDFAGNKNDFNTITDLIFNKSHPERISSVLL